MCPYLQVMQAQVDILVDMSVKGLTDQHAKVCHFSLLCSNLSLNRGDAVSLLSCTKQKTTLQHQLMPCLCSLCGVCGACSLVVGQHRRTICSGLFRDACHTYAWCSTRHVPSRALAFYSHRCWIACEVKQAQVLLRVCAEARDRCRLAIRA